MKVILDVNKPSCLSWNVQVVSSVEGFLGLQEIYPDDDFVIDPESFEAYETYMKRLTTLECERFLDDMHITKSDYDAMIDYYVNVSPEVFVLWEEQVTHEELLRDEYYAELKQDYWETLRDAMPRP